MRLDFAVPESHLYATLVFSCLTISMSSQVSTQEEKLDEEGVEVTTGDYNLHHRKASNSMVTSRGRRQQEGKDLTAIVLG